MEPEQKKILRPLCLTLRHILEGYYNGDINHPDPRPGHAIWVKKKDAEKLFMLFNGVKER